MLTIILAIFVVMFAVAGTFITIESRRGSSSRAEAETSPERGSPVGGASALNG